MKTGKTEIFFLRLYSAAIFLLLLTTIPGIDFSGYNSMAIICLSIVWLAERNFRNKLQTLKHEPFVAITFVFYLLYVISIFTSANTRQAIHTAQNLLPLFILPVILFSINIHQKETILFLFKAFIYGTALYMGIATIIGLIHFSDTHNIALLFYHNLVMPLKSTAIYASMLCMISLVLILHIPASFKWKACMLAVFSIWILMLSSRMAIFIYLLIILISLFTQLSKKYRIVAITALSLIFICLSLTNNPIRKRYADFEKFKTSYLEQPSFNKGMYFDGLSLRLIYWRYSLEILKEKRACIFGVGSGDAKDLLSDKIRSYHMDIGNGTTGNEGYLRYLFHDAYQETLVSFGIVGLCVLLIYYGYTGYFGIKYKVPILRDIFIIMAVSSFSDLIVIDAQCDLSLIIIIICLAMQYDRLIKTETIFKNNYS